MSLQNVSRYNIYINSYPSDRDRDLAHGLGHGLGHDLDHVSSFFRDIFAFSCHCDDLTTPCPCGPCCSWCWSRRTFRSWREFLELFAWRIDHLSALGPTTNLATSLPWFLIIEYLGNFYKQFLGTTSNIRVTNLDYINKG